MSDFMVNATYSLRNTLLAMLDQARAARNELETASEKANQACRELEQLEKRLEDEADGVEKAAELLAASDLAPSWNADVPPESGLFREARAEALADAGLLTRPMPTKEQIAAVLFEHSELQMGPYLTCVGCGAEIPAEDTDDDHVSHQADAVLELLKRAER